MDGRNLDLGNGEAMVIGTAADLRTAADYLDEHYPDGGDGPRLGPVTGPILNMGIRLITEVMDWAPDTLTQREHKTLMIFAEDAIDGEPGELDDHGREKRVIRQRTDSPQMRCCAHGSAGQGYTKSSARWWPKDALSKWQQAAGITRPGTGFPRCHR